MNESSREMVGTIRIFRILGDIKGWRLDDDSLTNKQGFFTTTVHKFKELDGSLSLLCTVKMNEVTLVAESTVDRSAIQLYHTRKRSAIKRQQWENRQRRERHRIETMKAKTPLDSEEEEERNTSLKKAKINKGEPYGWDSSKVGYKKLKDVK